MASKKIFSKKIAEELMKRGFPLQTTTPNYQKYGGTIYLFENSPELMSAKASIELQLHKDGYFKRS